MAKDIVARLKVGSKTFEIMVNVDSAMKIRKNLGENVQNALAINTIFTNARNGSKAGGADLMTAFGTEDIIQIATRIIKKGEMEIPQEYRDTEQENKKKKVIDYFVRNAIDVKSGRPFTPQMISSAIDQAGVNIDNRSLEQQLTVITEKLQTILPLRIETKKLAITIPAVHTGKAYGVFNDYKEKEDWLPNGDLRVIINVPIGLQSEFYDKLNAITHGAALSEEIKEAKK